TPVTRSVAGESADAPATSEASTAYPSMLELSKDGRATAAVTSSASTHPSAAASSRLVGVSGLTADRIADWCASTGLSELSAAAAPGRPGVTAPLRGTCGARG